MKALVSNFQKDSRKNFSHRRRRPEAFGKKLRTVCFQVFQPQKEKKKLQNRYAHGFVSKELHRKLIAGELLVQTVL
jgi:hypothetical protein